MGGKFSASPGTDGAAEFRFQKPVNRVMKLCER
jgi:hypothetical protein